MSRYTTCPDCSAHLDPGEACGCFQSQFRTILKKAKESGVDTNALLDDVDRILTAATELSKVCGCSLREALEVLDKDFCHSTA